MDQEARRATSRALFGNLYFLEVCQAIAVHPKGRFTQQELANGLPLDKGLVGTVLRRLLAGGLIQSIQEPGKERPLERLPSVFWEHCVQLHDELGET